MISLHRSLQILVSAGPLQLVPGRTQQIGHIGWQRCDPWLNDKLDESGANLGQVRNLVQHGRGSCFHTTAPENEADYFTVRVELLSGSTYVQDKVTATILRLMSLRIKKTCFV